MLALASRRARAVGASPSFPSSVWACCRCSSCVLVPLAQTVRPWGGRGRRGGGRGGDGAPSPPRMFLTRRRPAALDQQRARRREVRWPSRCVRHRAAPSFGLHRPAAFDRRHGHAYAPFAPWRCKAVRLREVIAVVEALRLSETRHARRDRGRRSARGMRVASVSLNRGFARLPSAGQRRFALVKVGLEVGQGRGSPHSRATFRAVV